MTPEEMARRLAEAEARLALLTESFETIAEIDDLRAQGAVTAPAEPVAASAGRRRSAAPTPGRMAAVRGRARPSPEAQSPASGVTVRAELGSRNIAAGATLTSSAELAEVMCEALSQLPHDGITRQKCARAIWNYPAERQLGPSDAFENMRRIDAVTSPAALVASGGTCLPVNVDYSVPTWAGADRPLRDGLPAFQADRGGVRFITPPDIGVPSLQGTASGLGSATSIWTEAIDAAPGGATKPVYAIQCGAEQLVYVNAIPTRLQFGNMQGRFAPEQVAANTELALAAAAREAELELLTTMYGASKQVNPTQYLGATRDLLASAGLMVEQYRYSHRIPESVPFVAVFPAWAKGVLRSDMAREIGHDNAGVQNALAITDAQIEEWLSVRGISNVIWTLDGLKAGTYGTGGNAITNQFFGLATAGAAPQWPGQSGNAAFKLAWLLYPEGTYQFLDGGRLDLGVVRDSTLDATNDYETFVETFEGVAFRGLEAYQIQSLILPNGGSAGTVAESGYGE